MAKLGAVGVGWMVVVVIDQVLGFMSSGFEKPAGPPTSVTEDIASAVKTLGSAHVSTATTTHLVLAAVIGAIAGFAGGWLAATIEDDSLAAKTLSFLLVFSALVSAGMASMAGYNDYAETWIIGGILQGIGCYLAGRAKDGG